MKTYIFMNEGVRDDRPATPVIVVQRGHRQDAADTVHIVQGGKVIGRVKFRRSGCGAIDTHHVRAWLELIPELSVELK